MLWPDARLVLCSVLDRLYYASGFTDAIDSTAGAVPMPNAGHNPPLIGFPVERVLLAASVRRAGWRDIPLRETRSTQRARVAHGEPHEVWSSRPLGAGQAHILALGTESTGRERQAAGVPPPRTRREWPHDMLASYACEKPARCVNPAMAESRDEIVNRLHEVSAGRNERASGFPFDEVTRCGCDVFIR